jgi:uncharacterized membrane protein YozB (DUF420 family)
VTHPAALTVHDLPVVNASLNGLATILLVSGYVFVKRRRVSASAVWYHAVLMIATVIVSAAFLACYLIYHAAVPPKTTGVQAGLLRRVYYGILIPHVILAAVMVPMILVTLWRAYRRQWERHRRIARPTFWIWLYVSVTGVVIYWMLYHLFPTMPAQ